jgi:uncharacterized membrane protein YfcA
LIGISLGLLGSGGSIITLPVLVYVAHVPVSQAVGMSLAIVGGTSLAGSALQYRRGCFDMRAAALFAVAGMAGAYFGSRLTHLVSPRFLMLLFAAMMLVVGATMLRERQELAGNHACRPWRCAGAGVLVGVLTGFLGVGGGFLIVPSLVLFAGLEMKKAIGTSLAVIACNSLAGMVGQLHYVQFNWGLALGFLGAATMGMVIGIAAAGRLSNRILRKLFAVFIIAVALVLTWNNSPLGSKP